MHDIRELVEKLGMTAVREIPIIGGRPVERAWWANLRADSALFVLERASQ
jgi:methanogenic corrinoid protein MtbC1